MIGARRSGWTAALVGLALAGAGCVKEPNCLAGQVACGGTCILADTVDNCVYCGVRCPAGASCTPSGCQCPSGEASCGYGLPCVSLSSKANCGACGHDCGLGTCSAATMPASCDCGTYTSCGPSASPECVNTAKDQKNCGACGYNCGLGTCIGGVCSCSAGAGIADCGAGTSPQCVDTLTDERNCGGCGNVCGSGQSCSQGKCCATGWTNCSGVCVNTSTDASNCGTCGNVCTSGNCSAGHCCNTGLTWCGTSCVNASTDSSNCGTCGNACSASQVCLGGVCQCQAPTVLACGTACCAGSACCNGDTTCQLAHPNGLGQTYYDCAALGTPGDGTTYTATMAVLAGEGWAPGSSGDAAFPCGGGYCNAVVANGQCAVWCYQSMLAGYVHLDDLATVCLCPTTGDSKWY